jgi:multidrug resistance efflux pump
MKPEKDLNIELRSDDVQEIMSHIPNWMIRWGITLIFFIIASAIFVTWFIKYPDIIQGKVTVTTKKPPIDLVAKESGAVKALYIQDRKEVKKGDVIATIGNALSKEAKDYLVSVTDKIKYNLDSYNTDIQFNDDSLFFGLLQANYIELKTIVLEYQYFLKNDLTNYEIDMLKEQIKNHTTLRSVNLEQLETARKEYSNAQKKYNTDLKLFEKQVISQVQLFEEEKKLIQAENNVGTYKKASIQNAITITDLKKQLNNLIVNQKNKQATFIQKIKFSLSNIDNALNQWGENFQVIASIDGQLNYLAPFHEHEFIEKGKPLFVIVPHNQDFIGYIEVPKSGSGKLKIGQRVRVKIDKYPHHEYGQLEGVVSNIALLANEDSYQVQFHLTQGMTSSYGKVFQYTPKMSGLADVITDDIRLISRIFNKFRKVFD